MNIPLLLKVWQPLDKRPDPKGKDSIIGPIDERRLSLKLPPGCLLLLVFPLMTVGGLCVVYKKK